MKGCPVLQGGGPIATLPWSAGNRSAGARAGCLLAGAAPSASLHSLQVGDGLTGRAGGTSTTKNDQAPGPWSQHFNARAIVGFSVVTA